ncbi:Putative 115 kDa protein in type-1 retrotransposable element R1DM [Eumeta japonica]|uniref:115 kDa protein in type-1 retrotransposable element R1DM n=1 Tax=Eumeta variegata TaxID=151549 RepID=A0A4C2ABQ3_EUMVA|nr:Putative 115 kDa protein in type-1 retrotransposable element R1DM [Eumeta japonica]
MQIVPTFAGPDTEPHKLSGQPPWAIASPRQRETSRQHTETYEAQGTSGIQASYEIELSGFTSSNESRDLRCCYKYEEDFLYCRKVLLTVTQMDDRYPKTNCVIIELLTVAEINVGHSTIQNKDCNITVDSKEVVLGDLLKATCQSRKEHLNLKWHLEKFTEKSIRFLSEPTWAQTEGCAHQEAAHPKRGPKQTGVRGRGEPVGHGIYSVIRETRKNREDVLLQTDSGRVLGPNESATLLAETFFPDDRVDTDYPHHAEVRRQTDGDDRPLLTSGDLPGVDSRFTGAEVKNALKAFHPRKAPGIDGFKSDICQTAIFRDLGVFLAMANKCLELGYFPRAWKVAAIKVIPKPDKGRLCPRPKFYRPIGLLPVLGKTVKRMLVGRLQWH